MPWPKKWQMRRYYGSVAIRPRRAAGQAEGLEKRGAVRPNTAMHPFGTIKCWMGATHFLMRRLRKVSTEMALNVLAYNIKRVIAIVGVGALLEAVTI